MRRDAPATRWRAGLGIGAGAGHGYPLAIPLGATAALYLLAASRDEIRPWTSRTTLVVVGFLLAYLAATAAADGRFPWIELLHVGLAWSAAWFAGERARLRQQQVTELQERAAAAEREAERDRLLAVAEERARIARDLHDSAGHAINVIAVRAGAARLRHAQEPERSLAALEAIEHLARQTVGEIDHMVGALRHTEPDPNKQDGGRTAKGGTAEGGLTAGSVLIDGREAGRRAADPAVACPPGMVSLGTLLTQHSGSGFQVNLHSSGVARPLVNGTSGLGPKISSPPYTTWPQATRCCRPR